MEVKVLQAGPLGVTALRDSPGAVCSWASSPASGLGPDNIDRTAVFWGGSGQWNVVRGGWAVGTAACQPGARAGFPAANIFTVDRPEGLRLSKSSPSTLRRARKTTRRVECEDLFSQGSQPVDPKCNYFPPGPPPGVLACPLAVFRASSKTNWLPGTLFGTARRSPSGAALGSTTCRM
jgi:hypothetical protein